MAAQVAAADALAGSVPGLSLRVRYRTGVDGQAWAIASLDGKDVGMLRWDYYAEPPVVIDISVDEQYRRRGIATLLFEFACRNESQLHHSDVLTDDGRGFVRSLGRES